MTTANISELSRKMKLSRPTVRKWLARDGAPLPDASGRYDLAEARAFIRERRQGDVRSANGGDLLQAKVDKLRLECIELRHKLKTDIPSFAVSEVASLLWKFLAEARRENIAAMNTAAARCINYADPAVILGILHEELNAAEDRLGAWCEDHALAVDKLRVPWPHSASFAWWRRGKKTIVDGTERETGP